MVSEEINISLRVDLCSKGKQKYGRNCTQGDKYNETARFFLSVKIHDVSEIINLNEITVPLVHFDLPFA